MIFLTEPNLTGNEKKYLNECIDTTFVSSVGMFVNRFEENVVKAVGGGYGTAVSTGTAGLHIALKVCGVQADDMVCIPSFTFIATANAVSYCGAYPWLIDISGDSWTMDPDVLEWELREKTVMRNGNLYHKSSGKRVAAIMPVYTLGMPADMDRLRETAQKYSLPIIADAAAAIGAIYKNNTIGKIADITVLSFNGNKTVTCGGGGAVVSGQKKIIEEVRHLCTTARCKEGYDHDRVGYNYRMTNIQAAVGCAQLERMNEFIERKKYIRSYYFQELKDISTVSFFPEVDWAKSACWLSGLVFHDKNEKNKMRESLRKKGIESRTFWKPIHLQKPYEDSERSDMSVSDETWDRILTLPCSTGMSDQQLMYIVSVLKDILK